MNDLIKMNILLKSGTELELWDTRHTAVKFHKRYMKYLEGLQARTDNYRALGFAHHVIVSSEVAMYSAEDGQGRPIRFE